MTPGIQFGGSYLLIVGVFLSSMAASLAPRQYRELVACIVFGLTALVMWRHMTRRGIDRIEQTSLELFGFRQELEPHDAAFIRRMYLIVALFFITGVAVAAARLVLIP